MSNAQADIKLASLIFPLEGSGISCYLSLLFDSEIAVRLALRLLAFRLLAFRLPKLRQEALK